jgi:sugar-specific transcriptional regulator TrmB
MNAEDSEEELNAMMSKLESEVNKLPSRLKRNESKARKRISNLVEMAELMIESYKLEYCKHNDQLIVKSKKFYSSLNHIKSNIERIINGYFHDLREEEEQ